MSVDDEERAEHGVVVVKSVVNGGFAVVEISDVVDRDDCDEYGDLDDDDRAGELLCFLMDLQAAALKSFGGGGEFDPKLYVDLPLKCSLEVTEAAFAALPKACATGAVEPGSRCSPEERKLRE